MIVMVALDDHQGLCFNHRRQSRDRVLRDYMLDLAGDSGIWLNAYSASMFTEDTHTLHIAEDFLDQAGPGEYALVEDKAVRPTPARSKSSSSSAGTGLIRPTCISTLRGRRLAAPIKPRFRRFVARQDNRGGV